MTDSIDLALIGAGGDLGEIAVDMLAGRDFPLGRLFLLDETDAAGGQRRFQGQRLTVEDMAGFDWSQVGLALSLLTGPAAAKVRTLAAGAGCPLIEAVPADSAEETPLVAGVNDHALGEALDGGVFRCAAPELTQLALVLKPLQDATDIESVDLVSCLSVSAFGKGGVEELASQTARLLNGKPAEALRLPARIAFNLLPQDGDTGEDGSSVRERHVLQGLRELLDDECLPVTLSQIIVPVFYGFSQRVLVTLKESVSLPVLRACLAEAPGLSLVDEAYSPNPVADLQDTDRVLVGRVRGSAENVRQFQFWTLADNQRAGILKNALDIAAILVKHYL